MNLWIDLKNAAILSNVLSVVRWKFVFVQLDRTYVLQLLTLLSDWCLFQSSIAS